MIAKAQLRPERKSAISLSNSDSVGVIVEGRTSDIHRTAITNTARVAVAVESHVSAVSGNIGATRAPDARRRNAKLQQRTRSLTVAAVDNVGNGVAGVVVGVDEALAAEVQHVLAVVHASKSGSLDERTVGEVTVEDACGGSGHGVAVAAHPDDDDPGIGLARPVGVAADATGADRVSVVLVQHPARAVVVLEAAGVDGAAEVKRAGERRVGDGVVGSLDVGGLGGANAVLPVLLCIGGGEVHHVIALVVLEDVRSPDPRVVHVNPGGEGAEGVVVLAEVPVLEVGGGCQLGLDILEIVERLRSERVPGAANLNDGRVGEVGLDNWATDGALENGAGGFALEGLRLGNWQGSGSDGETREGREGGGQKHCCRGCSSVVVKNLLL
jgi:hypothetical protein